MYAGIRDDTTFSVPLVFVFGAGENAVGDVAVEVERGEMRGESTSVSLSAPKNRERPALSARSRTSCIFEYACNGQET